jgi:hypothetical protein
MKQGDTTKTENTNKQQKEKMKQIKQGTQPPEGNETRINKDIGKTQLETTTNR